MPTVITNWDASFKVPLARVDRVAAGWMALLVVSCMTFLSGSALASQHKASPHLMPGINVGSHEMGSHAMPPHATPEIASNQHEALSHLISGVNTVQHGIPPHVTPEIASNRHEDLSHLMSGISADQHETPSPFVSEITASHSEIVPPLLVRNQHAAAERSVAERSSAVTPVDLQDNPFLTIFANPS